jgi:hypothetical protein
MSDFFGTFPEVGTRRFFDTIRIVSKRKGIEVHLEDFIFAVGIVELIREVHLLYLSLDRLFISEDSILDKLLRYRRGSFESIIGSEDIFASSSYEAHGVDTRILEKCPILSTDDRIF